VLLRPHKAKKNEIEQDTEPQIPSAPFSLQNMLMTDFSSLYEDTCKWSLSGAQFPQPTILQQRYCYPKVAALGSEQYCAQKGGSLWTMYTTDGKEDLTYRILHVYFSAKRASNKALGGLPSNVGIKRSQTNLTIENPSNQVYSKPAKVMKVIECNNEINYNSQTRDILSRRNVDSDLSKRNENHCRSSFGNYVYGGTHDIGYQHFQAPGANLYSPPSKDGFYFDDTKSEAFALMSPIESFDLYRCLQVFSFGIF
jgi:putative hemolysin